MRWGWLLPDASYQVHEDGWERQSYRPRHGKPPFVIRGAYSAAMVLSRARERYLGAIDEDYVTGTGAEAVAGARAAAGSRASPGTGAAARAGAGARAGPAARAGAGARAAGVGAASVGTPGRPRRAD